MPLSAGKLRHVIKIQRPVSIQNADGSMSETWEDLYKLYAAIEPLSAKEFLAASTTEHKVTCRIIIRYKDGLTTNMRILHGNKLYNIEGLQTDIDSGIEYITIPCSTGVLTNESQQS